MRNYFTFGGVDSRTYGLYTSGSGRFTMATREYELVSVPGRSGDIALGGRRISNFDIVYPCVMVPVNGRYGNYNTLQEAFFALRNALLSVNGYAELRDSYTSGAYYHGIFMGDIDMDSTRKMDAGEVELEFSCKPQRFLDATSSVAIQSSGTVLLQTNGHRGYPIITVKGTGSFTFWSGTIAQSITISQNFADGLVINSVLKECYSVANNNVSANQYVRFAKYKFPEVWELGDSKPLQTGINSYGITGTLLVRWYDL